MFLIILQHNKIGLPSVARHQSMSLVVPKQPHNPILTDMLASLGGFVECETEDTMNAMMVVSGLMGSLYGTLVNNRNWLVRHGVSTKDASYYVGRQYWGMMQDAVMDCDNPSRFDDLVEEQTPGGLNEQALGNLERLGVFDAYDKAMDALLSRLEGKSDGSFPNSTES
jgi:pyrroline-5-carboxylate reductase